MTYMDALISKLIQVLRIDSVLGGQNPEADQGPSGILICPRFFGKGRAWLKSSGQYDRILLFPRLSRNKFSGTRYFFFLLQLESKKLYCCLSSKKKKKKTLTDSHYT